MKAATYYGAGDIRVENVSDPELNVDGIVIQVKACGICGSDLHPYKIEGLVEAGLIQPGLIMGHEFSGDVVAVGANVTGIKEGDRVTAHSILPCKECESCRKGESNHCLDMKVLGFHMNGALAEYVSIPLAILNQTVFLLPEEISYEVGATVEPLSVGANVAKRAEPGREDVVVVLGAGMIGQCALQSFKKMNVAQVIVSEVSRKRLEVAKTTGADIIINAAEEDPVLRIREITSSIGADIVAECAGKPITFDQAIGMVRGSMQQAFETKRPDGRIMLVGVYEEPIQWMPIMVINNSVRLIGCFSGGFAPAIDLLKTGKVNTASLITHEFPLDQAREAFETQLRAEESIKVLIKP